MTGFDYVVIGIVGLSLLFGLWRGVVGEIIALVAWVLAIFVAVEFGAQVGPPCLPACLTRHCGRWPVAW
jgi:membrane protein required for colicin V production